MEGVYQDDYSTAADFTKFENQKENIQPLRQGRSAAKLAHIFSQDEGSRQRLLEQQQAEFETALESINITEDEDPLDIYYRYVRWTLEHYPQGHNHASRLVPLLERVTRLFQDDERYSNDPRHLKLWLMYVEHIRKDKEDLFRFLMNRDIGQNLAMFYEEYALWLEKVNKVDQAKDILELGINRRAQPLERLRRRYAEFQQRQVILAQEASRGHNETDDYPSEASVVPHGGRSTIAPLKQLSIKSTASARSVLTGSRGQVLDGDQLEKPRGTQRGGVNFQIFTDQQNSSAASTTLPDPPHAVETLQSGSDAGDSELSTQTTPWKDFGTQISRRKENLRDATTWTGATLPQSGRVRPGVQPTSKFTIFVDQSSPADPSDILVNSTPVTSSTEYPSNPSVSPLFTADSTWSDSTYRWPLRLHDQCGKVNTRPPDDNLPQIPTNPAHRPEYFITNLQWIYQSTCEVSLEELRALAST
ncbi:protein kinase [Dispira parvispora]|uniref:Protein kinase n=1 Tax=Dispira parvispora TaxID=1520584 RepID=A0A9W8ARA0_9FUNG|nr:protein kinase [Dispira parvispora]